MPFWNVSECTQPNLGAQFFPGMGHSQILWAIFRSGGFGIGRTLGEPSPPPNFPTCQANNPPQDPPSPVKFWHQIRRAGGAPCTMPPCKDQKSKSNAVKLWPSSS
eukprot:1150306-Pelagomonas_calceolata.AAC.1